jgi:hypothetical protein
MARYLVLAVPLLVLSLASCRAVKPDGPLKDLVDGEIFTGDTRGAPPRHENDVLVEPPDTGGPLRWKMRF